MANTLDELVKALTNHADALNEHTAALTGASLKKGKAAKPSDDEDEDTDSDEDEDEDDSPPAKGKVKAKAGKKAAKPSDDEDEEDEDADSDEDEDEEDDEDEAPPAKAKGKGKKAKGPTLADVQNAVRDYGELEDEKTAMKLVKKVTGATKVADVDEEDFAKLLKAIEDASV